MSCRSTLVAFGADRFRPVLDELRKPSGRPAALNEGATGEGEGLPYRVRVHQHRDAPSAIDGCSILPVGRWRSAMPYDTDARATPSTHHGVSAGQHAEAHIGGSYLQGTGLRVRASEP